MKKILFISSLFCLTSALHATTLLEGKFSYFRPDSHVLREVFSGWMPVYQLETRTNVGKYFYFWGSVAYSSKEGRSLAGHQKVDMHVVPLTAGMEYMSHFSDRYKIYAGAGARYFFVNVINHSKYVHRTDSKNGLGGAFRVGSLIYPLEHFVIDLCIDYSLKTFDFSGSSSTVKRHHLDLSGVSFGVGLGYKW